MNTKNFFKMAFLTLTVLNSSVFFKAAFAGEESGGGGDPTEARVDEVRADILKWINEGGHKGLTLPKDLTQAKYAEKMISILHPQAVTVSFVTSREEEVTNDPELKVTVNHKKKTCRGFISERDQRPNILCNVERFSAVSEADQYPLIHHEYAGLVRVEKNNGASSDYEISNQLTGFLEKSVVLKLAVKSSKDLGNVLKSICNVGEIKIPTEVYFGKIVEGTEGDLDDVPRRMHYGGRRTVMNIVLTALEKCKKNGGLNCQEIEAKETQIGFFFWFKVRTAGHTQMRTLSKDEINQARNKKICDELMACDLNLTAKIPQNPIENKLVAEEIEKNKCDLNY